MAPRFGKNYFETEGQRKEAEHLSLELRWGKSESSPAWKTNNKSPPTHSRSDNSFKILININDLFGEGCVPSDDAGSAPLNPTG
jgi:hypothetical protein